MEHGMHERTPDRREVPAGLRDRLERLAERDRLEVTESFPVKPYTPSLWRSDAVAATGELAPGLTGTLALMTIAVEGGGTRTRPAVLAHLPATIARLPELLCRDAFWRVTREYELTTGGLERLDHETVFESVAVERRFAVEHPADTDPILLRRIFSPTFLDWLGAHAPADLTFELVSGRLGVVLAESEDLDVLWESAQRVASRIRDELAEGRRAEAAAFAEPLPPPPALDEQTARGVARVSWGEPPADVAAAAAAYRRYAGRGPVVYLRAWAIAAGIAAVPVVIAIGLALLGDILLPIGLFVGGIVIFWTVFPLLVRGPRDRLAAEWGKLAFAEQLAIADGLELEDPTALHERWPELALPGPVRRLWRGTSAGGRTFRLMLIHDPGTTPGRSGFEGVLVEVDGPEPAQPAGPAAERIAGEGLVALVRPTPIPQGPTIAGLRQLRAAVEEPRLSP